MDFFFYTLWNICRWFLDPNTSNKVHAVLTFAGVEEFVEPKWIPRSMVSEFVSERCIFFLSLTNDDGQLLIGWGGRLRIQFGRLSRFLGARGPHQDC